MNKDTLIFEERFHKDSLILVSISGYTYFREPHKVLINKRFIKNDSLNLLGENNWFNSHLIRKSSIPLNLFKDDSLTIKGWKTNEPYFENDKNFYALNVTILGKLYKRLNVSINNKPMQVDGDGNTMLYSRKYGIVRTTSNS